MQYRTRYLNYKINLMDSWFDQFILTKNERLCLSNFFFFFLPRTWRHFYSIWPSVPSPFLPISEQIIIRINVLKTLVREKFASCSIHYKLYIVKYFVNERNLKYEKKFMETRVKKYCFNGLPSTVNRKHWSNTVRIFPISKNSTSFSLLNFKSNNI